VPAEIEVRRVVPTDWPALRQPRLEALVDAPVAAAYSRLGFLPTGHREPYPLDVTTQEVELALPLR